MTEQEIALALAAPFAPEVIGWKAQAVSGNRAMAVCYIDARDVMDRLDAVVGVAGWSDEYDVQADGSAVCRLFVRFGDREVTKTDVGSPSEQPDEGDRRKAAFSDALKRAAVKFGIGRYLYRLEPQWVDYDPAKKRLVGTPRLPASALPVGSAIPEAKPRAAAPLAVSPPVAAPRSQPERYQPPADGRSLRVMLDRLEQQLLRAGLCESGELVSVVVRAGYELIPGPGRPIQDYPEDAVPRMWLFALQWARERRDALGVKQAS